MKKIRNYGFMCIMMIMAFFIMKNTKVNALEEAVINANSAGVGNYIYDEVQYTRSRDITVTINLENDELATYDTQFGICEFIPAGSADNVRDQETCSYYLTSSKVNSFQLSGRQDGEKTLNIYFYSDFTTKARAKTITKKIVLDTIGPVINLTGGEYIFLPKGQTYSELGATCTDDSGVAGECTVVIGEVNIDMNETGYQYITYTAEDFLGNEVNVVRKVLVESTQKDTNYLYWVFAGIGVAILAAFLLLKVLKNKEKQKNQSVL